MFNSNKYESLNNGDKSKHEPRTQAPKETHPIRKEMMRRLGLGDGNFWGSSKHQTEKTDTNTGLHHKGRSSALRGYRMRTDGLGGSNENILESGGSNENTLEKKDKREAQQKYRETKNEINFNWKAMLKNASITESHNLTMEYIELRSRKTKKELSKGSFDVYAQKIEGFKDKMAKNAEQWKISYNDAQEIEGISIAVMMKYKEHRCPNILARLESLGPEALKELGASKDELKNMYTGAVDSMDKMARKLSNNVGAAIFTVGLSKLYNGKKVRSRERSVAFLYGWIQTFEMALGSTSQPERSNAD